MNKLLQGWSAAQAELQPEAAAIVKSWDRCSYGELEIRGNQIARALVEAGAKPQDRIALIAPRSIEAVAGMLGILKAGCTYVPLDPGSSAKHAAAAINQCECAFALATGAAQELAATLQRERLLRGHLRIGWLEARPPQLAPFETLFWGDLLRSLPGRFAGPAGTDRDLAYILFEPAAAGEPKGVMVEHRNVVHYIDWVVRNFSLGSGDRLSGLSPLGLDLAAQDIYSSLAAGAELHLATPPLSSQPDGLAQFIRDSKLTHWLAEPSLLAGMALDETVGQDDFPMLKRIIWRGDLATPALIYWMRRLPHVSFWRLYGPAEATIASSFYHVPQIPDDPAADTPIGLPLGGERLYVLDRNLAILPPASAGDLYISGRGLSPGYWRDQDRTREAFLPNPIPDDPSPHLFRTGDVARLGEDGLYYLLGKADAQANPSSWERPKPPSSHSTGLNKWRSLP